VFVQASLAEETAMIPHRLLEPPQASWAEETVMIPHRLLEPPQASLAEEAPPYWPMLKLRFGADPASPDAS
jgi:hypothetical protein